MHFSQCEDCWADRTCQNVNNSRELLYGALIEIWIGDQKTEGKFWVKTWTVLLSEFFSRNTPGNIGATGLEREGRRERGERLKEREKGVRL